MTNGSAVAAFEREFAQYVGAKYAIGLVNGTATLHTALVALGVKPGDRVAVPPLTMSATTIAVLHAGAVPVFVDVDPDTWLMDPIAAANVGVQVPVSLYGLHYDTASTDSVGRAVTVDDAAQTLRRHDERFAFTSYSFQASKHLALGEGGMLATNDEALATRAREFSSLGYRMRADQPRIDPATLKHPSYERHHSLGWNYRMADAVAEKGLRVMGRPTVSSPTLPGGDWMAANGLYHGWQLDVLKDRRRDAAEMYRQAIAGCDWITPQHVPEGSGHDYWAYAVALASPDLWEPFTDAIVRHGGERPFGAWRLTYQEPAFRHLAPDGTCPVAEGLQPRLVQFQTNDLARARFNADAVAAAIREIT